MCPSIIYTLVAPKSVLLHGERLATTDTDEDLNMDHPLLHVANVLYLASYSVRDILWLRALTVLAMLCLGWVYWNCDEQAPMIWQGIFLAINLFQIGLLIRERRPVKLTEVQQELIQGPLSALSPRQVQRFTEKAQWTHYENGDCLISENTRLQSLILLLSGEATVRARGKNIAKVEKGQFVGEMSFLTGGLTTADVIASGPVHCAQWPENYITEMIQRDRDLGSAIQAALGTDLVQKLLRGRD